MNYVKTNERDLIQSFLQKKHKENSMLLIWRNVAGKRLKINQGLMFIEIKNDTLVFYCDQSLNSIGDGEIYLTPLDFEISLRLKIISIRQTKSGTFLETDFPKEIVYNEKRKHSRSKFTKNNINLFIYHTDDKKNKLKAYLYDFSAEGMAIHVPKKHFHIIRLMENIQITIETHSASIITVMGKIVYLKNNSPHHLNSSLLGIKLKDAINWSDVHGQI